MTYPPTGPYGQSSPSGSPNNPGSWGQPPSGPYGGQPTPAGGFGQGGTQQFGQADPWGQQQGGPQQFGQPDPWGQQGGYPGGEPPKKKTGLIIGAVVAVVLLVGGGITAALLLTGKDDNNNAAPPANSTPTPSSQPVGSSSASSSKKSTSSSTSSSSSSGTGASSPDAVAQGIVDSINSRNITQYSNLMCTKMSAADMDELQAAWDADPTLHASLNGTPTVTGSEASVRVSVTFQGETNTPKLPMVQKGSTWCADINE
ncbi:hypothetical protein [Amycolatopsis taiwanensis]|uniref:DUF4878 domain-containing protein n=1 Tax=Amycolatopsis taiwanensis TaxID=342230 RepID=A0A9W6VHV4_9PSEU|nr:hypothetical protein [Amycolatopsis taiwanensis]GLY67719.1 hypothetical protein Atai01_43380 [Amycolatopsis taiwanensis]